jgi:hypothetical protein
MIFPIKLSAEQCSSTATATYKAELAERICDRQTWKIADLTGGLGVDTWHFSKHATEVLYNEMQPSLCEAAEYNFHILACDNITISNNIADMVSVPEMLESFRPDIVYLDPARRGDGGKKVFLIEECTPDILTLKDCIFKTCRNILVKLSPMAYISMVCSRLGHTCREVHIVAAEGECKELLVWMDREWNDEYSITAVEMAKDGTYEPFVFLPISRGEEKAVVEKFRNKMGYTFPMGLDTDQSIFNKFASNYIPRNFVVGKDGKVIYVSVGYTPEEFAEMVEAIANALK